MSVHAVPPKPSWLGTAADATPLPPPPPTLPARPDVAEHEIGQDKRETRKRYAELLRQAGQHATGSAPGSDPTRLEMLKAAQCAHRAADEVGRIARVAHAYAIEGRAYAWQIFAESTIQQMEALGQAAGHLAVIGRYAGTEGSSSETQAGPGFRETAAGVFAESALAGSAYFAALKALEDEESWTKAQLAKAEADPQAGARQAKPQADAVAHLKKAIQLIRDSADPRKTRSREEGAARDAGPARGH